MSDVIRNSTGPEPRQRKGSGVSGRRWWITVTPSGLCADVYDDREQATSDAARYERSVIEVVPAVVTDEMIERGARVLCGIPNDVNGLTTTWASRRSAEAVLRAALEEAE